MMSANRGGRQERRRRQSSSRPAAAGNKRAQHTVSWEDNMKLFRRSWSRAIPPLALLLTAALCGPGFAQAPAFPAPLISVAEAHAIIEGAVAAARERNLRLGVVVVDPAGELVAAERMDGAPGRNIQFAEGKAFASVMYRTTSQAMSELYKTAPARYFGIMNSYGNKIYLVGGGIPLVVDGKLVGGVGIAGTNQDEVFAEAGIAAWEKVRASLRK
jgi:glc operon protein GlcG